jgi:hypothetical protein
MNLVGALDEPERGNNRYSRREFLNLSGVGIAGVLSGQWLGVAATAHAQATDFTARDPISSPVVIPVVVDDRSC